VFKTFALLTSKILIIDEKIGRKSKSQAKKSEEKFIGNFMVKNKVFLDTSILITALLSPRGGSFYIITRLKDKYQFQINKYVLDETLKVLNEKFSQEKELDQYLFLLMGIAKIKVLPNSPKESLRRISKIINKKDAPILISSIQSSNFLLTLDKDFLNQKVLGFVRYNITFLFLLPENSFLVWKRWINLNLAIFL